MFSVFFVQLLDQIYFFAQKIKSDMEMMKQNIYNIYMAAGTLGSTLDVPGELADLCRKMTSPFLIPPTKL